MTLGLPERPRRTPLRLRGVLPVIISVRRSNPLVIPLADAVGKTFRQDGGCVRVESISSNKPPGGFLMLVLSEDAAEDDRSRASSGPQPDHLCELVHNRLEFENTEGHPMNWVGPHHPFARTNGEFRTQVHFSGPAPAAQLRVYRLSRMAAEIPITFDDVPAP